MNRPGAFRGLVDVQRAARTGSIRRRFTPQSTAARACVSLSAKMKRKLATTLCVLAIGSGTATTASADEGAAIVTDIVLVRPVAFAATVIGAAFFVLSLPVALTSKSVDRAAQALVVAPARATFTRPLGDFDALKD